MHRKDTACEKLNSEKFTLKNMLSWKKWYWGSLPICVWLITLQTDDKTTALYEMVRKDLQKAGGGCNCFVGLFSSEHFAPCNILWELQTNVPIATAVFRFNCLFMSILFYLLPLKPSSTTVSQEIHRYTFLPVTGIAKYDGAPTACYFLSIVANGLVNTYTVMMTFIVEFYLLRFSI